MSRDRIARIDPDFYHELKKIQRKMKEQNGVSISMGDACRIFRKNASKGRGRKLDLSIA